VFDEVNVMAYGLARVGQTPRALLFEVPIAVSNGITPLWFWLQALPAGLFGETAKLGLRTLPLLLGLAGVLLAWRAAGRLRGARAAWLAGLLYATADLLVFTSARGEYAESLLAPLLLLLVKDLLPRPDGEPIPLRSALWPALLLFTYLGKGLVCWGAYAFYLALLQLLGQRRLLERPRSTPGRTALLIVLPLLPSLAWLAAAEHALFASGGALVTDLGPVRSVWENVWRLTGGYGSEAKAFMVAGWKDSLYVYRDFAVWPTLALLAVPTAATLVGAGARVAAALRAGGPLREADLLPLGLALPPFGLLVAKGALDARFHLLYLAPLLPFVAGVLDGWLGLLEHGRWKPFLLAGLLGCGSVAAAQAGALAAGLALAIAGLALAGSRSRSRHLAAALALAALSLLIAVSGLVRGPLDWARRWAWEPSPVPGEARRETASYPNADLQLAACFLDRDGPAAARAFLWRALERHPQDPATVMQAAEVLLGSGSRDAERLLPYLGAFARRHPEDAEARRLLTRALELAQRR
jgi:hypothetical protein